MLYKKNVNKFEARSLVLYLPLKKSHCLHFVTEPILCVEVFVTVCIIVIESG